jgi:hypothetical protein
MHERVEEVIPKCQVEHENRPKICKNFELSVSDNRHRIQQMDLYRTKIIDTERFKKSYKTNV